MSSHMHIKTIELFKRNYRKNFNSEDVDLNKVYFMLVSFDKGKKTYLDKYAEVTSQVEEAEIFDRHEAYEFHGISGHYMTAIAPNTPEFKRLATWYQEQHLF